MKNYHIYIPLGCSALLSIGAFVISLLKIGHTPMSIYGGVIASFSVLITILIGWQVFTVISFSQQKKELKELISLEVKREREIQKEYINDRVEDAIAQVMFRQAIANMDVGSYELCFHNLMSTIEALNMSSMANRDEIKGVEETLFEAFHKIKTTNTPFKLNEVLKDRYIEFIKKSKLERANEILLMIFRL